MAIIILFLSEKLIAGGQKQLSVVPDEIICLTSQQIQPQAVSECRKCHIAVEGYSIISRTSFNE